VLQLDLHLHAKKHKRGSIPPIAWKLRQVEGWINWSHGSKDPPFAWITSNRLQTALEELLHTVHHTMVVDPTPGDKFPGRPHFSAVRTKSTWQLVQPTLQAKSQAARSKVGELDGWPAPPRPASPTLLPTALPFACKYLLTPLAYKNDASIHL
jgi:hypothetical protein